jgi:hypothetical protein
MEDRTEEETIGFLQVTELSATSGLDVDFGPESLWTGEKNPYL